MKPQIMATKIHQAWSWKTSSKKPNQTPLSQAERNIMNTILEGIVKRVINYKSASKNNNMLCGWYTKIIKEYEDILLLINKKCWMQSKGLREETCSCICNYLCNWYFPPIILSLHLLQLIFMSLHLYQLQIPSLNIFPLIIN